MKYISYNQSNIADGTISEIIININTFDLYLFYNK